MTRPPAADAPDNPFEMLTRQVLDCLARGARVGDIIGMTERDYECLYSLGHTLYRQKRFAEAARIFGHLVAHNHTEARYLQAYAAALQMTQDYRGAIGLYTLLSVMDFTDPEPCFHTCECLIALGLKSEAIDGLAMVITQCEHGPHEALRRRAQALLQLITAGQAA